MEDEDFQEVMNPGSKDDVEKGLVEMSSPSLKSPSYVYIEP